MELHMNNRNWLSDILIKKIIVRYTDAKYMLLCMLGIQAIARKGAVIYSKIFNAIFKKNMYLEMELHINNRNWLSDILIKKIDCPIYWLCMLGIQAIARKGAVIYSKYF